MRDEVLILNFHNDLSRAVTRKLRAERVLAKIVPGDMPVREILSQEPLGLILAGGEDAPGLDPALLSCGIPLLALRGMAASLLSALGGREEETLRPGGLAHLACPPATPFACLDGIDRMLPPLRAWALPAGTSSLADTEDGFPAAFGLDGRPVYGAFFPVEAVDPDGAVMLRDFALNVCCCTPWWDEDAFSTRAIEEIRRIVGNGRAACAVTGGLDSGVCSMLAHKALGPSLQCLFVDTGFLREGDSDALLGFFRDEIGMDVRRVDARDRFLSAVKGVADPREKRRAISDLMQQILSEERRKMGPLDVLIRGTSANDVMFLSGETRPSLDPSLPVIEPARELFMDEIRRVGDFLGIPADLMSRQPFPASGLAMRILGEVTEERLRVLRAADAIFRSEVILSGAAKRLWQYFAVLCPIPLEEDGVVICLRAVHASEQSLAYAARLPYDVTEAATDRILHDLPTVRRVVYDLTPSTHYAGIEWQ